MIIWDRLRKISSLHFKANSASQTGWNGEGHGSIRVELVEEHVLLFHEQGTWTPLDGPDISFRNIFRWTLSSSHSSIQLEHLRFGKNNPVFLFELQPFSSTQWTTSHPHHCGKDIYDALLEINPDSVIMNWHITGPAKDENLYYTYR